MDKPGPDPGPDPGPEATSQPLDDEKEQTPLSLTADQLTKTEASQEEASAKRSPSSSPSVTMLSSRAPSPSAEPFPATPAASNSVMFSMGTKYGSGSGKRESPKTTTPSTFGSASGFTPTSKTSRGLRHFSVQVCKFVESRGKTTYNEVADNLVRQVIIQRRKEDPNCKCDEKNIRRRVYDALNVLMAMDIISKDKKEIIWKGLPGGPEDSRPSRQVFPEESEYDEEEVHALMPERDYRRAEIERKQEALREILVQQVCFRNLVVHNQRREYPHGRPHNPLPEDEKIPLPFIISNTKPSAVVQCDMNPDKTDVMFEFDSPFEINDDNTILKRMDM